MKYLIPCILLLAACGKEQPAAPTSQQSEQLDEAENLLNAVASNEEGPADRSTGPSNMNE